MEGVQATVAKAEEKVAHITQVIHLLQKASDDQDAEIRKLNKVLNSKSSFPHLKSSNLEV